MLTLRVSGMTPPVTSVLGTPVSSFAADIHLFRLTVWQGESVSGGHKDVKYELFFPQRLVRRGETEDRLPRSKNENV